MILELILSVLVLGVPENTLFHIAHLTTQHHSLQENSRKTSHYVKEIPPLSWCLPDILVPMSRPMKTNKITHENKKSTVRRGMPKFLC